MFESIKELIGNILKSRLFVVSIVMMGLTSILIYRIFTLQIVNGQEYLDNYTLKIEKTRTLPSTRGNIYDRDGVLLAYNELAYSVIIEDNGSYASSKVKNQELNGTILEMVRIIESHGDALNTDFNIILNSGNQWEFTVEGRSLQRFRADVYGHSRIEDLKYNTKLKYDEASATAEQVIDYLCSTAKFGVGNYEKNEKGVEEFVIGKSYTPVEQLQILNVRYGLSQNSFQKYITTTVATEVSDETVAIIKENSSTLQGVTIETETIRKYTDSKYFAHIIGYTGKISQIEYDELSIENEKYDLTDVIGKAGIEQKMELELQGTNGSEDIFVDNVGKVVEVSKRKEPSSGNNVYLTLDSKLQKATYDILEQQLAGILYANIKDIKEYNPSTNSSASDIIIPIYDVYYALINNNIIKINEFEKEEASEIEKQAFQTFVSKHERVLTAITGELSAENPLPYNELDEEMQVYMSYIASMLLKNEILIKSEINKEDSTYLDWTKNEIISLKEYLNYAISMNWIDNTKFETDVKYSDTSEIYNALLAYIEKTLIKDNAFTKKTYRYLVNDDEITGRQLCLILFEQKVFPYNEEEYQRIESGALSAYSFLKEKIKRIELTPAQLALDPCSGSSVITDVNTGEVLACVSYPGYDNNRLANSVDSEYFSELNMDLSLPLYNYATQQQIAPGSTFKMVSAVAGMSEGVVSSGETMQTLGIFDKVGDPVRCWIAPSNHGIINIAQAIQNSCNFYFYELAYRLSSVGETFKQDLGIERLTKYAEMFGLGEVSGIEINENKPQISNEYPITSAIGQGNHSYTTTQLARYVTTVANRGKCFNLSLLDSVQDATGNVIKDYTPTLYRDISQEIDASIWDTVQLGMRLVVEKLDAFSDVSILAAGKTGTAQQIKTRPNHAVFVGYAPFDNPEIAIATRIAYGYTSANAVEVSSLIMKYYYDLVDEEILLNGEAHEIDTTVVGEG